MMPFLRSSSDKNNNTTATTTDFADYFGNQQQFDTNNSNNAMNNDTTTDDYDNIILNSRKSRSNEMDEIEQSRQAMIYGNEDQGVVAKAATRKPPQSNKGNKKGGGKRRAAPPPQPPMVPESNSRRALLAISTLAIIGGAGYLTWKYGLDAPTNWAETQEGAGNLWQAAGNKWNEWDLGNFSDVLDGLDNLDFGNLFDGDPKLGDNTTYLWEEDFIQPSNGGLHLTLRNALDDNWQTEFEQAVSDWQESDALVLETERVDVDHTCTPVDGYMVVCNANFGATGWVGINENSIVRDVIVSSVAKMNEYYLMNADYDHRRFTMCHEIGHGFGLPHTDENPYNDNLGNCLDYTDDPSSNVLPGDVNMDKLRGMYLTRRLRRVEDDGTVVERTELVVRR
ncbi:hypothetical protein ACHAXH_007865 [Discostella pseudostelligera]